MHVVTAVIEHTGIMDAAAAKARLSAKKQQSQSLKVQGKTEPMAVIAPLPRFSSPAPLNFIASPPPSALPNKKLRFSDVEPSPKESEYVNDDALVEPAIEEAQVLKSVDSFRSTASVSSSGAANDGELMQVCLRIRPLNDSEKKANSTPVLTVENPTTVRVTAPETSQAFRNGEKTGTFTFSRVFDESVSQADLHAACMANATKTAILDGENAHVFAYGMTNAGKTFTITGTDENPGILPRTLASIFRYVDSINSTTEAKKLPTGVTSKDFVISVSYLEIYNEQCFDLLGHSAVTASSSSSSFSTSMRSATPAVSAVTRAPLQIKDGRDGVAYVRGLRHVTVTTAQAALEIMKEGANNKRVADTHMNADSSRSHTVFTISVFLKQNSDEDVELPPAGMEVVSSTTGATAPGYKLWSRISIVDLAGSERQSRTNSVGARLKEAGAINNSLMQLMKCFETMRHNVMHPDCKKLVPFRDTKLTRLFADSFGGLTTGTTTMIVNAGPAAADFDETLHALKYGALAKDVRVVKDRIVTRWEPGQYGENGRRIVKGGATSDSETENESVNKHGMKKAAQKINGTAPVANFKKLTIPAFRPTVPEVPVAAQRAAKESISSVSSISSAISMSLISAVLKGEGSEATLQPEHFDHSHDIAALPHELHTIMDNSVLPDANLDVDKLIQDALAEREAVWEEEKGRLLESIDILSRENEVLTQELEDAHESAAGIEGEVREEVAAEMMQKIAELEEYYKAKLISQASKFEERIAKMQKVHELSSSSRDSAAFENARDSIATLSVQAEMEEKIEELTTHVAECEAEIERLTSRYDQDTSDLRAQLNAQPRKSLTECSAAIGISSPNQATTVVLSRDEFEELQSRMQQLQRQLKAETTKAEQLHGDLGRANEMLKDLRLSVSDALSAAESKHAELCETREELIELQAKYAAGQLMQSKLSAGEVHDTSGRKRSRGNSSIGPTCTTENARKRSRGNSIVADGPAPSTRIPRVAARKTAATAVSAADEHHTASATTAAATKGRKIGVAQAQTRFSPEPKLAMRSPLAPSQAHNMESVASKADVRQRATVAAKTKATAPQAALPSRTPMVQRLRSRK